jgi:hypothetical protein
VTKIFASFVAAQSDLEDAEKWCWSFRKVFWKRAPPTVEKLSFYRRMTWKFWSDVSAELEGMIEKVYENAEPLSISLAPGTEKEG